MSIHEFIELCETAYWKGQKDLEFRRPLKAGEFIAKLPPDVRERLCSLKSEDLLKIRYDAIKWMLHPDWVYDLASGGKRNIVVSHGGLSDGGDS